jgi:hypothetical protein
VETQRKRLLTRSFKWLFSGRSYALTPFTDEHSPVNGGLLPIPPGTTKLRKWFIRNAFTLVNEKLLYSSLLGVTCHLFFRCKAAFALPIAYPDLAEG